MTTFFRLLPGTLRFKIQNIVNSIKQNKNKEYLEQNKNMLRLFGFCFNKQSNQLSIYQSAICDS